MASNVTKRQHYVWRAYLESWSNNNKINCLMDGKVFPSNLMGVAQSRYFYRLHELNSKEINQIVEWSNLFSYGALKEANLEWIKQFKLVFEIKAKLTNDQPENLALIEAFKSIELQIEESLHSMIEGESKKYIDMLLDCDTSFIENEEDAMKFYFFFTIQYVRTPRLLENMKQNFDMDGIDIAKVWSQLKIIAATNIAWSLFSQRSRYKLYILKSNTKRFITGDQPIINTHAVGFEGTPDNVEFFYPLSPHIALLISDQHSAPITEINDESVAKYNEMIFKSSYEQIYAWDPADLQPYHQ